MHLLTREDGGKEVVILCADLGEDAPQGALEQLTPKTGEYAFGWGLAKIDWTPKPVITHNGSNSLNLAMILLDTDNDLGIVVATNIPSQKADTALLEMAKALYGEYGPR